MAIIRITTGENSLPRAGSGTEGRVERGGRRSSVRIYYYCSSFDHLDEIFWDETLLRYSVAIYKTNATEFRNIFFLGKRGWRCMLRNRSFSQHTKTALLTAVANSATTFAGKSATLR